MTRTRDFRRTAFTLIEVLVVVAIIALLVAIMQPSLRRAREQARTVACLSQLRQLMLATFAYAADSRGRVPGTGRNDDDLRAQYDAGTRADWLSWFGTWQVLIPYDERDEFLAWANAPQGGRLWRYYRNEALLKCPSARNFNGKHSYSMPENVALAMPDPTGVRAGLPPIMEMVRHPSDAIIFLDEDEENGISTHSLDDGFGESDMFADRHLGKASVAFFDGHAEAHFFPRGVIANGIVTPEPFRAWMIQIAPFNSRFTPAPWRFRGRASMPRFRHANWPPGTCTTHQRIPPGCECCR